jgi:hypothetical protein
MHTLGNSIIRLTLLSCLCLMASCATHPDIVQVGVNRYLVSVTSAAGAFASASGMKTSAINGANTYARKQGGIAVETESSFNRPAVGFPTYDFYFKIAAP